MTWLYGFLGLALGLTVGWAMHAYVARAIEAENLALRRALQAIRWGRAGVGTQLLRYIDRILGEEAG